MREQRDAAGHRIDVDGRVAPIDVEARQAEGIESLSERDAALRIGLLFRVKIQAEQIRLGLDDDGGKFSLRKFPVLEHVPAEGRGIERAGCHVSDMLQPGRGGGFLLAMKTFAVFVGNQEFREEQQRQDGVSMRRFGDSRVVEAGDEVADT